jgi:CRISPR system Cascade subunit CasB
MTTATPATAHPELDHVGEFVHRTASRLQSGYLADRSSVVAELARLRRGVGEPSGAVPDLWGLTANESLCGRRSVGERLRKPDADSPSDAEEAAHIALTLYATHQQSHHDRRMHVRGRTLGGAVRRLMPPGEIEESIRRRFVQAGNAHTVEVLAQRLRELVLLLRREAIPLDYGLLADQLVLAQDPQRREWVRRAWGRSFHAYRPPHADADGTPGPATTEAISATEPDKDDDA